MKKTQARIIFLFVFLCIINTNSSATKHRTLLLVCNANSTLTYLSPTEIRRLFLNLPVVKDGVQLKPLRNASDSHITNVFLQKVIFMSERSYKRKLLSRIFRYGGRSIPVYSTVRELQTELHMFPEAVTYMWSDQVEHDSSVKSLGVLWDGLN